MRPVLHGDVASAARALLAAPPPARPVLCRQMIGEAELADRHVGAVGRLHPLWGDGSLMSAARRRQLADEPSFDDPDYCACFEMVLRSLRERRISPRRSSRSGWPPDRAPAV